MYRHEKRPLPVGDSLDGSQAYRLKQWPQIPDRFKTARVLGACSRMTVGPVTASWLLKHTGLDPAAAAELIADLVAQGALERIELAARVGGLPAAKRVAPAVEEKGASRLALRFRWKQAAVAAIVCLGVSAALDSRIHEGSRLMAVPNLPAVWG